MPGDQATARARRLNSGCPRVAPQERLPCPLARRGGRETLDQEELADLLTHFEGWVAGCLRESRSRTDVDTVGDEPGGAKRWGAETTSGRDMSFLNAEDQPVVWRCGRGERAGLLLLSAGVPQLSADVREASLYVRVDGLSYP